MDRYYYFVSQLPYLHFDKPSGLSCAEYLLEASKWLSVKDYCILENTDIKDFDVFGQDANVLKEYKSFEYRLRHALKAIRESSPGDNFTDKVNSYISGSNPLEAEKKLLFLRWQFAEDIQADNFFSLNYLIIYFLKLQILERLSVFNKDEGLKAFDKLCEVNYE